MKRKEPNFPKALATVLEMDFGGKQAAMAMASDIDASLISRYLSGDKVPDPASLDAIIKVIPKNRAKALAEAFLSDQMPGSLQKTSRVSLAAPAGLGKAAPAA